MSAQLTPLFGILWERPWVLALALVPLIQLWRGGRRRELALATSAAFRELGRGFGWARWLHVLGRLALIGSFVLGAVALAGPRQQRAGQQQRSGIDVVVALDLSTSMNALDLAGEQVLRRAMTPRRRMRTRTPRHGAPSTSSSSAACDRIGLGPGAMRSRRCRRPLTTTICGRCCVTSAQACYLMAQRSVTRCSPASLAFKTARRTPKCWCS